MLFFVLQRYAGILADEMKARDLQCEVEDLASCDPEETLIQEAQNCGVR